MHRIRGYIFATFGFRLFLRPGEVLDAPGDPGEEIDLCCGKLSQGGFEISGPEQDSIPGGEVSEPRRDPPQCRLAAAAHLFDDRRRIRECFGIDGDAASESRRFP